LICGNGKTMVEIDGDRLLADLKRLRGFGAHGTGVVRLALSPIDLEARHWLVGRMQEAGLEAAIDGVGTVFGRSRKPGPALLIGSHTDTQPTGGWLDGALGVMYGLEIARALGEAPDTRDLAVDVASWIDEEGTFASFLGSRSFCGDPVDGMIAAAKNREGQTLTDALAAAGIAKRPRARFEAGRQTAYLEPHIEQGGRLEASGKRIGVVTTIVGIRELRLIFTGQRNHAGTTPMAIRKDAGMALIRLAHEIDVLFRTNCGPETVWTMGRIELDPGSPSIVPGRAKLLLQFRDPDGSRLGSLETKVRELVRQNSADGPVRIAIEEFDAPAEPTAMDARLQDRIAEAAEAVAPGQWVRMPSGAGHDAQILARRLPAGMLFIPSIGGVSHDFVEDTSEADIVLGCRVAAEAAVRILRDLK
jgi:N-carbamoyl-L-amino-acid hydrolase